MPGLPVLKTLGPKLGCLTPSAAPNILFPGSPILGPPIPSGCKLVATIAGSAGGVPSRETVSPNEEVMSELSVGWDGSDGSVGEGSRTLACRLVGIDTELLSDDGCPFGRKLPLPFMALLPELIRPWAPVNADIEAARALWVREGLDTCWPREFTV